MSSIGTSSDIDLAFRERQLSYALAGGLVLQLAGRVVDARWHAAHDEFEGASEQLQAHWLIWLGVLATLLVSALAARTLPAGRLGWGWKAALVGSAGYAGVAAWHFAEHAQGDDPDLPHVLLVLTWAVLLIGVVAAVADARRRSRASGSGPDVPAGKP